MMLEEMDRNYPEKGDTWVNDKAIIEISHGAVEVGMDNFLVMKLKDSFNSFMDDRDVTRLEHIANYSAMIRLRAMLKEGET